jgi:murein DD-endopeptidase MepM/ murein hydrolase activator NlpD
MQAKLLQLEALGDRVSGLAGVNTADLKVPPGRGGALVSGRSLTLEELQAALSELDQVAGSRVDVLTVIESRLLDQKIRTMMIPTQRPVSVGQVGSPFGWRIDPFTGHQALHTGLDFASNTGTPITAAAGGVVITQQLHPEYGNMVEIDHGNGLVTRYAHASKVFVHRGDLVKRGQKLAEVGTTGRSTGPHLHFEVLVGGVPQNPQKFLDAGMKGHGPAQLAAATPAPAAPALGGRAER